MPLHRAIAGCSQTEHPFGVKSRSSPTSFFFAHTQHATSPIRSVTSLCGFLLLRVIGECKRRYVVLRRVSKMKRSALGLLGLFLGHHQIPRPPCWVNHCFESAETEETDVDQKGKELPRGIQAGNLFHPYPFYTLKMRPWRFGFLGTVPRPVTWLALSDCVKRQQRTILQEEDAESLTAGRDTWSQNRDDAIRRYTVRRHSRFTEPHRAI